MWFETDLVGPKVVREIHQNNGGQLLHVNFEHYRFFWFWLAGTIVSWTGWISGVIAVVLRLF